MPIPTFIPELDETLKGGLPDTGLVLIGSLVSSGQQALATHLAVRCARATGRKVHHWSWRDSECEARARMIAAHMGVALHKVRNYRFEADEFNAFKAAVLDIESIPLELHTESWAHYNDGFIDFEAPELEDVERIIETHSIHIVERIDDLCPELHPAPQRHRLARALAEVAREREALVIVMANSVWPRTAVYGPEPQPIANWPELMARADLTLLAGPIHPLSRDGLQLQVDTGDAYTLVWCPVDKQTEWVRAAHTGSPKRPRMQLVN